MTHERADDFNWQENKAFADIVCNGLKQQDIEDLEAAAEDGMHQLEARRVFNLLTNAMDELLQHFDPHAVMEALEMHINCIDEAYGGEESA